jgi:hypothetical protein
VSVDIAVHKWIGLLIILVIPVILISIGVHCYQIMLGGGDRGIYDYDLWQLQQQLSVKIV